MEPPGKGAVLLPHVLITPVRGSGRQWHLLCAPLPANPPPPSLLFLSLESTHGQVVTSAGSDKSTTGVLLTTSWPSCRTRPSPPAGIQRHGYSKAGMYAHPPLLHDLDGHRRLNPSCLGEHHAIPAFQSRNEMGGLWIRTSQMCSITRCWSGHGRTAVSQFTEGSGRGR